MGVPFLPRNALTSSRHLLQRECQAIFCLIAFLILAAAVTLGPYAAMAYCPSEQIYEPSVRYESGTMRWVFQITSWIGACLAFSVVAKAIYHRKKRHVGYGVAFALISAGAFISSTFFPPASPYPPIVNCRKPVIYLYPESATDVEVKLRYKGDLTVTYPPYEPAIEGWKVKAFPNGKLINLSDNREYSYLFWEGLLPSNRYSMPSDGLVVEGAQSLPALRDLLAKVGLTPAEYNEFIVYWYPQIKDFPYVQIALAGDEYEQSAPLAITPKPGSMLRVFVYFKRLTRPIDIPAQNIAEFSRKGFTVVEWGGTVLP